MNTELGSSSILVHPTRTSIYLFEILQGKYAYVRGQTLHSSLRNPGIFSRQIFIYLYNNALSSCTYDDVFTDWSRFKTTMRKKWEKDSPDTLAFRRSTFQSWITSMKLAIENTILSSIFQFLHSNSTFYYERYVDWVITTGLVPTVNVHPNTKLLEEISEKLENLRRNFSKDDKTGASIIKGLTRYIIEITMTLTSLYIPDYSEVQIEYNTKENKFIGIYNSKKIQVAVINRPVVHSSQVTFDTPLQRLMNAIMTCHRTAEHAKLCQLLNTSPLKAILGHENDIGYKDILKHLEKSSQKNDPKKELLTLIMKLAENKTVSGVTDVVEDFITDVSHNIVDKNKLFGSHSETTTQGLRRHVSDNVFKCLTKQINEQFDVIKDLEKERELYLARLQQIETHLLKLTEPDKQEQVTFNLLTTDTLQSLENLGTCGLSLATSSIPKGSAVLNSFLSQYVPPFRELNKDLTLLWENEMFQTYKLAPVVDNQGHRLTIRYTQDTISMLLGPFTYLISKLGQMDLINEIYSTMSVQEIAYQIYLNSRLSVYMKDIGGKYCPEVQDGNCHPNPDRHSTEGFYR
ncbi:hypothetical protein [Saguinine gammaherpesvirus 1]|uniref:Portal protein n=2 Tax=unclassified Gammaherpesvirinae TaxID=35249 RepID=A0A9Q8VIS2_9GAMA|nr:hypothetical protein [Saguinine gammaherpesvirus 1]WIM51675.1 MAG: portal protein [Peromyscus leucopus gammaherpesvirus]